MFISADRIAVTGTVGQSELRRKAFYPQLLLINMKWTS